MRKLLALVGLVALLAAPYGEQAHGHGLGQIHQDCAACQVRFNHADLVVAFDAPANELICHRDPSEKELAVTEPPDPLLVAPKTSPPSPAAQ